MLLFDTHAWVWTVEGDERRVGRRTRQLLSRGTADDAVRISTVSIFEVASLYVLGRLRLPNTPEQWVRGAIEHPGVRIAELTPSVAIDAGHIPRTVLGDPLDRLLVATARQLGATFLTADGAILDYASRTGYVRVHDVSL